MSTLDLFSDLGGAGAALRDWSAGIIVDNFAGGGGTSTGIEWATGRDVDVAINHDPEAVAMHIANHPHTRHHCQSIWSIDPLDAVTIDGTPQPVFLAWFSPDCTHHSNARGGKPREKNIRDLAWVIIHWIDRLGPKLRPAKICIENVEEFLGWGPLDDDGHRIMDRQGEEFDKFVGAFRKRGYTNIQWRVVKACDHGAPTIRKRLVIKASCDGEPIRWAEPLYGPARARPYRAAAECIDWSLPCPSIFLTKEEGRAIGVKRPLADATMRRIARGVMRYVVEAENPFVVDGHKIIGMAAEGGEHRGTVGPFIANLTHQGGDRIEPIDEPFRTITGAKRGEKAIVIPKIAPFVSYAQQGGRSRDARDPMHTVTASPKDQNTLVAASLIQMGYGEREGQAPRVLDIEAPLGTIVAGGGKHALVAAFLAQHNTMPAGGIHPGRPVDEPMSTVTTTGSHQGLVSAHLLSLKGSDRRAMPVDQPAPAITAGGYHVAEVRAFLIKYYGSGVAKPLTDPMGTVTVEDRFGLVIVVIGGVEYAIVDIGMRMLTPPELAAAQGFPRDYKLDPVVNGKPLTKTAQVRMIGNSVSPPMADAEIRALLGRPLAQLEAA